MAQDRKIKLDDISRGIDSGLNTSDQQRVAALERLQTMRKAKATSLNREQQRIAIKYGAEHPRSKALAARVELNRGFINDLVIEAIKAKVEIPIVDQATWVLHGFVRDRNRTGLPDLTVALFDGREHQGAWLRDLGYACSDKQGYFKLTLRDFGGRDKPVFLRVLNSQGATLYYDSQPLTPKGGQVDYREIIIGGEARDCTPPTKQATERLPTEKDQPAQPKMAMKSPKKRGTK